MSAYAAILSFKELRLPKINADDRKFENLSDTYEDQQPLRNVSPATYPSTEYHNQYNNQSYPQYSR